MTRNLRVYCFRFYRQATIIIGAGRFLFRIALDLRVHPHQFLPVCWDELINAGRRNEAGYKEEFWLKIFGLELGYEIYSPLRAGGMDCED